MKINTVLSASILAGAVLLSSTACTGITGNKEGTPTAAPASTSAAAPVSTPSDAAKDATPSESPVSADTDASKVATIVNGYYNYVLNPENAQKVQDAGTPLQGGSTPTDEQLKALAKSFPEGFKFFDTSSPELIENAYAQLFMASSIGGSFPGLSIVVAQDAITIDGDKATINITKAKVTSNGKAVDSESDPYSSDVINLVKKENGSWLIVAESSAASVGGSTSGSGEATIEDTAPVEMPSGSDETTVEDTTPVETPSGSDQTTVEEIPEG